MHSRGRLIAGATGALALALLCMAVPVVPRPDSDGSATRDSAGRPAAASAFTVGYVLDGDTIEASPENAAARALAGADGPVRIRLIGIDTPEATPDPECGAEAARDRLRQLLPEDATVWAAPDREARDWYGRLLLYLWTDDGGSVNETLLAEGHAEALRIAPNTRYAERFAALADKARRAETGLWGACT